MRDRWLTAPENPPSHYRRLMRARLALDGRDDDGRKVSPGMFDPGVISFSHGEGMRRPTPDVIATGIAALLDPRRASIENYRFLERCEPLEHAIAKRFVAEGIPDSTARTLCIDAGTTRVFAALFHAATRPGDAILVAPTFYHPLSAWCWQAGCELVQLPSNAAHEFKVTAAILDRACELDRREHDRRRIVILFNPSPTGAIYSARELSELAAVISRHDLLAVEDVIFAGTEFAPGPYPRLAALRSVTERTVTIGGASKAQCLANLRLGWASGPKRLIDEMNAYTTATGAAIPALVTLMGAAALEMPDLFVGANTAEAQRRALLVEELVATLRAALTETPFRPEVVHRPQAAHSVLLSLQGPWSDSLALVRWTLARARVSFSPAYSFGLDGPIVRANFASLGADATHAASAPRELLAALDAVAGALPGDDRERMLAIVDSLAARANGPTIDDGFARGRAEIREAFVDRLLPALLHASSHEAMPCRTATTQMQLPS